MREIEKATVLEMDVPLSELVAGYYKELHESYGEDLNEYLKDVVRDAIIGSYLDNQIDKMAENVRVYTAIKEQELASASVKGQA